ncbi:DUF433 domain-containing protein [Algoriphagus sp. AGSA1]|uniref:DUF433 domain-containing protein n=1 Tax=Algoriphagus sp. AGSA1 TaxID=2907213 RepID=UPI001F27560A|nr:DUF433 domain-containing protein [Algoriphagus sp. AGSA1]MCE7054881.1 DUF433 domain-containing protein [Algoriphagus sp. AGSA1]
MEFIKYIEINPSKRLGQPSIIGIRISVADVLNWLASGMSKEEIVYDFPKLSLESINACLFFAATREKQLGIAS